MSLEETGTTYAQARFAALVIFVASPFERYGFLGHSKAHNASTRIRDRSEDVFQAS